MSSAQANEVTYELHSLGWKAFQNLCATIVAEIWGQTIQTYFDSNDGGRDGAFSGEWEAKNGDVFSGSFVVQCKFTAKSDALIKIGDLTDELNKTQRLSQKGLCDNYFIFTNARLTGVNDEEIRARFEGISNLKKCHVYGRERITQIIHERPRLRMLVPRLYGLGDVSQILDERAYDQAREILSSLGNDLGKFIITDAYRKSAKALVEHGFVLLLGEPMCGKSTIAAALAMGALDEWGCSTIKVRDADEFVRHYNPHEKQLFWVDDAFGATQFDWASATNWSKTFPHVNAAIHKGAKVIFTSRDYIYKSAKRHLKESALPIIKESQVVIQVESLSKEEREQILYNHIKLGTQNAAFKKQLKPFLPAFSIHEKFSPEIARRLGSPFFTKDLVISKNSLNIFVEKPLDMLLEVINTMDDECRSALALVFIRGGVLASPLDITKEEKQAISRLGGTVGGSVKALDSLNGSLLLNSIKNGDHFWHFKHPTIRDAFAAIVASSQDLMDIYLTGAPLEKLFSEVSCGHTAIQGISVIVPPSQFNVVIRKIKQLDTSKSSNKLSLCRFLSYRCDEPFLKKILVEMPDFVPNLSAGSYLYANSEVDVLVRLHEFGLLEERHRNKAVCAIKDLAVDIPDSGFLRDSIKTLISEHELSDILQHVKEDLIPNLDAQIDTWHYSYSGEDSPSAHFEELKSALEDYQKEFEKNEELSRQISDAIERLNEVVENLESEYKADEDNNLWDSRSPSAAEHLEHRSIFDDVEI